MKVHLLELLEHSRNYTVAVGTAMPEENYAFRPAEGLWDFQEQFNHITYGIKWWEDNFVSGEKTEWNPPPVVKGKKQVLSAIHKAYDELKTTIEKGKADEQVNAGVHATLDHITHHRGQAIIYLRCKGIAAPEYTY